MLAHLVNDGAVYLFAALIPYYTQTLGMSYVKAGFAWTLLNLVGSLPQPFLEIEIVPQVRASAAGV